VGDLAEVQHATGVARIARLDREAQLDDDDSALPVRADISPTSALPTNFGSSRVPMMAPLLLVIPSRQLCSDSIPRRAGNS
jgi:hypothetical protein